MATTPVSQLGGVTGGIPRLETPSNVHRLLDENAQLIKCISDDHNAIVASSHGEPETQEPAKKKRGRPRKRRFMNESPSKESDTNGKLRASVRSLSVRFKNGTGRDGSTALPCSANALVQSTSASASRTSASIRSETPGRSMRVDGDIQDNIQDQCTQKTTSTYSSIDSRHCILLSPSSDYYSVNTYGIPFENDAFSVDNRPKSKTTLRSRVRELEVERDTVCAQGRGYRCELARIIRIVNPEIDIESSMSSLLQELETILRSVDQTEEVLARYVGSEMTWKRELDQSLMIMKAQEETMNEMKSMAESRLNERAEEIKLLTKCFNDVSMKLNAIVKTGPINYIKPFVECSKREKTRRVSTVDCHLERVVGSNAEGNINELDKVRILSRIRRRLNVGEEIVIDKWSTDVAMQLQCIQGWSDAQMERLRSFLVQKNMNFLPSQKSMRDYRKAQWDKSEWEVRYDEKGHVESEQCIQIRKNLTEQLQRAELSGNLNREHWAGHVGYCIVFDAGGGTTKVAGTVMNSMQPNSVDHIVLLGMYKGGDGYDEMKKNMDLVIDQINDLVDQPYAEIISSEGVELKVQLDVLVTADYKALCEVMGHSGPCSLYNCILCRRKAGRTENTGKVQIGNQKRLEDDLISEQRDLNHYVDGSFSVHRPPLFKIPLTHIIPPALHMMMGLVKPFVSSLEQEMFEKDMAEMGYSAVTTVDEAKVKMAMVTDERDFNKDVLETLKQEITWLECALNELRECEKWSECRRLGAAYCSQKCLMRGRTMKSLPAEYRESLSCISCKSEVHLYCCGAFTLSTMEILKMSEKFRCFLCREQTIESRIEECEEMLEAMRNEMNEYHSLIVQCDKDLKNLNEVIFKNSGPNRVRFEEMLERLRISRQKYFNAFNGNDVRRMLQEGNVDQLMTLSSHSQKEEIKKGMMALGRIMGAAKATILSDIEIDGLERDVEVYKQSMVTCFPSYSVTPKCHLLLAHVVPFVQKWKTWGLASEQAIESMHATVNTVNRRYHNLKNEEHKWMLVTRELSMRRKLRDKYTIFE